VDVSIGDKHPCRELLVVPQKATLLARSVTAKVIGDRYSGRKETTGQSCLFS
jgi:hypothetical protein